MNNPTPAPSRVSTAEIADLLAWARSLTEAGRSADPDQRAAYQAAKTALLARLTQDPEPTQYPRTVCD
jgi:hypothetical protein